MSSQFDYDNALLDTLLEKNHSQKNTISDISKKLKFCEDKVKELVNENQLLRDKVGQYKRSYIIVFILSLISTICVGMGINMLTDQDADHTIGLIFLGIGIVVECLSFVIPYFIPPQR